MEGFGLNLSPGELTGLHFPESAAPGALFREELLKPQYSESLVASAGKKLSTMSRQPTKFILFDQKDSEGVMVLHSDGAPTMNPVKYDPSDIIGFSGSVAQMFETFLSSANKVEHDALDSKVQLYKQAMVTAFAELQKSRFEGGRSEIDLKEHQVKHQVNVAGVTSSTTWHENTEDLDALMDSDDDDEFNSDSATSGVTQNGTGHVLRPVDPCEEDGYLSSEGETNGRSRSSMQEAHLSIRRNRRSTRNRKQFGSRKAKVRSRLRLLRKIIPGGETMNTPSVLEEAIRQIRNLQAMVGELESPLATAIAAKV